MNAYEFIVRMKDYASSELRKVARSAGVADRNIGGMKNTLTGVKRLIIGAFSVAAISMFTNKVIDARAEYERFDAVLTNTFQSAEVGRSALSMLTDFAAKTPYQLNELTGSFVKLVNRGFNPTRDQLTKLGDLAASQGKGFDQLSEAILDAETAEFERLKEFGIRASKSGDQISLSFKGVTKTVQNNSDAIRQAIVQYGNMQGVSGSMDSIAKTLGGRISNLKDQWWGFLVAVGGQTDGVFSSVIDIISNGLAFITEYLPEISQWFQLLWSYIERVGLALWNFLDAAFGFSQAGDILGVFGNVMNGVLLIVDLFTTGLMTMIEMWTPLADVIMSVIMVWAGFNALMAVTPLGWIIIGLASLITLVGAITKYTSGWGDAWQHTVNGAKYLWQSFTDSAESVWTKFINNFMIGINRIKTGWYEFRNAVGLGESSDNNAALKQIQLDTELRKQEIAEAEKSAYTSFENAKKEFSQVAIEVDTEGLKRDFNNLKSKFSGLGEKSADSSAYKNYLDKYNANNNKETSKGDGSEKGSSKIPGSSIVGGGAKKTNINITIQKLQDDTKIFVSNTEQGLEKLGDEVQEILLRALNSAVQMQNG